MVYLKRTYSQQTSHARLTRREQWGTIQVHRCSINPFASSEIKHQVPHIPSWNSGTLYCLWGYLLCERWEYRAVSTPMLCLPPIPYTNHEVLGNHSKLLIIYVKYLHRLKVNLHWRHDVLWTLVNSNVAPSSPILFTLIMEAIRSSEMSVLTRTTRRHIPEDGFLHSHSRENLEFYVISSELETFCLSFISFRKCTGNDECRPYESASFSVSVCGLRH
jgi:hypothetical protein